ncbi:MAG: invasion associated locus B family protein [Pseudomonadota bacterium]
MSYVLIPFPKFLALASVICVLGLAPATAQDTASPDEAQAAETPPTAPDAAIATEETTESDQNIEITEYGDWELRCETSSGGCFMYQLANNNAGNPVAELRLVNLPDETEAAAGATVITPLGTLLPEGLVLQIDERPARQYPFGWCTRSGCFSRFGLTAEEVSNMRSGNIARLRIVSVSAPDQPVILDVSLTGFTAAHRALTGQE